MKPLSQKRHLDALRRRRIKFVVEKGAMARLFRQGTHTGLQEELCRLIKPSRLARIRTRDQYDKWLSSVVGLSCWRRYSRNGLTADRWAYFAKLVNIVVYETVTNHELFSRHEWTRIQPLLHVPIDATVLDHLVTFDPDFPVTRQLKGMTKHDYCRIQEAIRQLARRYHVPPIWFEEAWTA